MRAQSSEAVIRARFPVYAGLPLPVVLTLRPPGEFAAELAAKLAECMPPHRPTTS